MIENFKERYAALLEGVQEDTCIMLSSLESRGGYIYQSQSIMASGDAVLSENDKFIVDVCREAAKGVD